MLGMGNLKKKPESIGNILNRDDIKKINEILRGGNVGDIVEVTGKRNHTYDPASKSGWIQTENGAEYVDVIGENGYQITTPPNGWTINHF